MTNEHMLFLKSYIFSLKSVLLLRSSLTTENYASLPDSTVKLLLKYSILKKKKKGQKPQQ